MLVNSGMTASAVIPAIIPRSQPVAAQSAAGERMMRSHLIAVDMIKRAARPAIGMKNLGWAKSCVPSSRGPLRTAW